MEDFSLYHTYFCSRTLINVNVNVFCSRTLMLILYIQVWTEAGSPKSGVLFQIKLNPDISLENSKGGIIIYY